MKINKGLFIGIDYLGTSSELENCRNDARDMEKLLSDMYEVEESILLLDDSDDDKKPTRENIIKWIKWLVSNNSEGDTLWLHYSGHGGNTRDTSGDEEDNKDETLIPLDFEDNGEISDDELNVLLCRPVVASGCTLYFHDDCCHSGTGADLRFKLLERKLGQIDDNVISETTYDNTTTNYNNYWDSYNSYNNYNSYDSYNSYNNYWSGYNPYNNYNNYGYYGHNNNNWYGGNYWNNMYGRKISKKTYSRNAGQTWETFEDMGAPKLVGNGTVIKWSGCQDDQYSSDGFNGMPNGAMTGCVITAFKETNGKFENWGDFLSKIRKQLEDGDFEQVPQLCFSSNLCYEDQCFV